jgi:GT2 family glycosyltransferase
MRGKHAIISNMSVIEPPARYLRRAARARRWLVFLLDYLRIAAAAARATWRRGSFAPAIARAVPESTDVRSMARLTLQKTVKQPSFRYEKAPLVSIVVPVYNHLDQTMRCLRSLAAAGSKCTVEIVVVDDGSTDGSAAWLEACLNVRLHRMSENSGFGAACNAGAAIARGHYLVFLNNDTEVTAGWLDALIGCFASEARCGLVGAKLVYPDGRLQEAGGIVFADGSACNYGRGGDSQDPRYDFVREVDYCSGACVAIPRALFAELGGFDPRYTPAYYEDTDLAFSVRAAGYRVIYQPRARIVHFEGQTAGKDVTVGVKQFQPINREKFIAKQRLALLSQPPVLDFSQRPECAATHRGGRRVLVMDAHYPHADRDSGSLRMLNMLILLRDLGCHVQFWAQRDAVRDDYARTLEDHGVELVIAPSRGHALRWWYEHGAELDIVLMSRLPVALGSMRLVRRYATKASVIFDTVDLHFLRVARGAVLHLSSKEAAWADDLRQKELGLMQQANLTLVVSEFEQELLRELVPTVAVKVLSTIHTVHGRQASFSGRSGLLFLGNFEHDPNVDAARWLIEAVMPLLRERLPGISLHVVGYAANDALACYASDDVLVQGYVADLTPILNNMKLALAPLRYGAGVKGKINMAMSYGVPIVTTTVGAEGMDLLDRRDAMIADEAEDFAHAIAEAYGDEHLWLTLSDGGLENVKRHFSPEKAREALKDILCVSA